VNENKYKSDGLGFPIYLKFFETIIGTYKIIVCTYVNLYFDVLCCIRYFISKHNYIR